MSGQRQEFGSRLFRNAALLAGMLTCVFYLGMIVWTSVESERQATVRLASSYSQAIMSFRSFYSETVVARLGPEVTVSHDYHALPHAIPIPATMTLDLVAYMSERDQNLTVAQVSDYPFPWRAGRVLTDAQRVALDKLASRTEAEVSWVERTGLSGTLHHATAIRMEATCVDCHNAHPDSPRSDWSVGDLRAIQVVSVPFSPLATLLDDPHMLVLLGVVPVIFVIGGIVVFIMDERVRRALRVARDKAEAHVQAMKELEDRQFAFDQHAIVSITDRAGRITYANQKFQEISGYALDELVGQNHRMVKSDVHPPDFYRDLWQTITGLRVWHGEVCNRRKDGSLYWVAATVVPLSDRDGMGRRYISIRTDITERKRIEQQILEQQRFLRSLTDALGEGVYAVDAQGYCTFLNPQGERLLGRSFAEVEGLPLHDMVHGQTADGHPLHADDCPLLHALKGRKTYRSDSEMFLRADGTVFPVSVIAVPLLSVDQVVGQVVAFDDITDQRRRAAELMAARDEAERASRAKSEFLSSMSHELRTPLNAILGFGQLLEQGRKEPLTERQLGHVRRILSGGEHLLSLINDILDLAKIESGNLTLSIEPVDTRTLVDDCLQTAHTLASARGITVHADLPAPLPWLRADLTRTRQVLLNLLSNAVKYNREGGSVTLAAERLGDRLRLVVTDTGQGIALEAQPLLFQPFNRLGNEGSGIEGTGIGLTITKSIIERMGGEIGFTSTPGEGSTFWVTLPVSEGGGPVALAGSAAAADPVVDEGGVPPRRTILYVEDNPANRALMEEILADHAGWRLVTAGSAEDGLTMACAQPPDLIIMDINLPGLDGFEALAVLRGSPQTARIPVIALSADAMPGTVERGRKAGFHAYLTKPVQVNALLAALHDAVNSLVEGRA